jgi:site-specific DNA-methyltransferase (adenine-specific)
MNNELMFSSATDEWYTPLDFYNELNNEFNFNLDPCATDENHKCNNYFTKADNGLLQSWGGITCFVTRLMVEL